MLKDMNRQFTEQHIQVAKYMKIYPNLLMVRKYLNDSKEFYIHYTGQNLERISSDMGKRVLIHC